MKISIKQLIIFFSIVATLSSCKVFNPNRMLRTGKHFNYDKFSPDTLKPDYKLAANDEISVLVFTNHGEKLMDPIEFFNTQYWAQQISYTIESSGAVKLPVVGYMQIAGLTISEAEKILEDEYAKYFRRPFCRIRVLNKRVIVFPGGQGGNATVINLQNNNTTLIEALAQAGGITNGRAHKIKLIRGNLNNPQVFLIDLSTIEGMKQANLVIQANDIIYVEPRAQVAEILLQNITPYLTLLSTALLIYGIIVR